MKLKSVTKFCLVLFTAFFTGRINTSHITDCWDITENVKYDGPLLKLPYETYDGCVKSCLKMPQCSIINMDIRGYSTCLIQNEFYIPDVSNTTPTEHVYNFFLDRKCKGLFPALDMNCWTINHRKHHPGFTQVPINNLYDCLNFCIGLPQCGAIEFDKKTYLYPCWVQSTVFQFKENLFIESRPTTNYILNRTCIQPENFVGISKYFQYCWNKTPNHNYNGLQWAMNINDVGSCSSFCHSVPQCQTFDFDVANSKKCWIQKNDVTFDKKNLKQHRSTVNYELDKNCYDKLLSEDLRCWIVTPKHSYSRQDLAPTSFNDINSCLAYCRLFPQCKVLDFDTTKGKCWIQKTFFKPTLDYLKPKKSSTNYFLDPICYDETSIVDTSCWDIKNRMYYFARLEQSHKVTDLKKCLSLCRRKPVCHIVNFDLNTGLPCWYQKEDFAFNTEHVLPNNSSITFILKPRCYKQSKQILDE